MKNYLSVFLLLFLFTACQDDDDNVNTFNCTADRVGDSILLPDDSESLTIDAIYQDSRCPCNANCLVAGGVGIRLLSSANDTLLIGVGHILPDSTLTYNGFNLRLLSVTHREVCEFSELAQGDYCVEFVWE